MAQENQVLGLRIRCLPAGRPFPLRGDNDLDKEGVTRTLYDRIQHLLSSTPRGWGRGRGREIS